MCFWTLCRDRNWASESSLKLGLCGADFVIEEEMMEDDGLDAVDSLRSAVSCCDEEDEDEEEDGIGTGMAGLAVTACDSALREDCLGDLERPLAPPNEPFLVPGDKVLLPTSTWGESGWREGSTL